ERCVMCKRRVTSRLLRSAVARLRNACNHGLPQCEDRDVPHSTSLLGWRREVAQTYAAVRAHVQAGGNPAGAHGLWQERRDILFAHHPDSPLSPQARSGFAGLGYAPYDPALRWTLDVDRDVDHEVREVPTATDGLVRFELVGRVHVPQAGSL